MKTNIILTLTIVLLIGSTILPALSINSRNDNIDSNNSYDLLNDFEIRMLMLKAKLPSLSVAIIKNESVVCYENYGTRDFFSFRNRKPNINTVYQAGSITKSVVATAVLQLFEKNKLDLDDDVNNYLDFSLKNPNHPNVSITFRMLLAHQSSIKPVDWNERLRLHLLFTIKNNDYPYPLIKQILVTNEKFYNPSVWADYAPGEKANYTNYGMIILEHIIEKITNQSFSEYCEKNIFNPLNMTNTSFYFKDFKRNQLALPYQKVIGFNFRLPCIDVPYAVGGVKTSTEDLSHYLIAHINNGVYENEKILNNSTIKLMHSIQYPESNICHKVERYGLGWLHWKSDREGEIKLEGHCGIGIGGTAWMMMNKTKQIGIIVFTNTLVFYNNKRLAFTVDKLVENFIQKAQEYNC